MTSGWTEIRGPKEAPYEALLPQQLSRVLDCASKYMVAQLEPSGKWVLCYPAGEATAAKGLTLGGWIAASKQAGDGVVLSLPPDLPSGMPGPARTGLELFCSPDPLFPTEPYAVKTRSLNEAQRAAQAGRSIVLFEPAGGWSELRAGLGVSWPALALAAVAIAALGLVIVARKKP